MEDELATGGRGIDLFGEADELNAALFKTLEQFNQISISFHLFPEQWNSEIEEKGLSEWLRSDLSISDVIYRVNSPGLNLWLLPAGEPLSDPVERMQSGRLAAVLDRLAESFDWIIIDSTPILPVAETGVWARLSQGILMVVREAQTEKRQLQKALDALESSTLLGVVLNSSNNNEHKSYYTYYSTQHSNGTPA